MKQIIRELIMAILSVCIIAVIVIALFYKYVPEQYETNYVRAMTDKYNRLISVDEPKIVLIGDSNLAFGVDSEYIQNMTGMPVVNMGLHGGLGNSVQTEIAMSNVRNGDIYVLVYSDFAQDKDIYQKDLTLVMLGHNKELWDRLSIKQKMELIPAIPDYIFSSMSLYIRGRGNEEIEEALSDYSRAGFNESGDNTIRIAENQLVDYTEFESKVSDISDMMVKRIKYWQAYCNDRGAEVVIAAYPIMNTTDMDSAQSYREFVDRLKELTGCKVISDYSEYIMDTDMFYDTILHLNEEGVRYRTELLTKDIKGYLDER